MLPSRSVCRCRFLLYTKFPRNNGKWKFFICFEFCSQKKQQLKRLPEASHLISLSILCGSIEVHFVSATETEKKNFKLEKKYHYITIITYLANWTGDIATDAKNHCKMCNDYGWCLFYVHTSCLWLQYDTSTLSPNTHTCTSHTKQHTHSIFSRCFIQKAWLVRSL